MMMRCEIEEQNEINIIDEEIKRCLWKYESCNMEGEETSDKWWRAITWSAQTPKIRPKILEYLDSINTSAKLFFYSKWNLWNTLVKALYL